MLPTGILLSHHASIIFCLQLEMILQAQEYERQGIGLQEFFDSTAGKFKTQLGKQWAEEIVRRRATSSSNSKQ